MAQKKKLNESFFVPHLLCEDQETGDDFIFQDDKKVTFYRIQESPELLLFRKDEELLYHFAGDLGFTMLTPHVEQKEEK